MIKELNLELCNTLRW